MASDFCSGSPFMDIDYLWNNTFPGFTKCFQDTILVVVPSVWLWVTSPILLALIYRSNTSKSCVPVGKLNIAKCVFTLLLVVIAIVRIAHASLEHTSRGESSVTADVILQAVRAGTLLYSIVLLQLVRIRGQVTSGILFLFWILELVTKIIPFYENIILQSSVEFFLFNIFYVEFSIVSLVTLMNCFAEPRLIDPTLPRKPSRELSASFLSRITVSFMFPVVVVGYRRVLTESDVTDLRPDLKSRAVVPVFMANWKKYFDEYMTKKSALSQRRSVRNVSTNTAPTEKTPLLSSSSSMDIVEPETKEVKYASAFRTLVKTFGLEYLSLHVIIVFFVFFTFIQPIFLQELIQFTETRTDSQQWKGYLYAILLFVSALGGSLALQNIFLNTTRLALKVRSAIISVVYRKALTMNAEARHDSTIGEIVNLMAVDTQRLQQICIYLWDSTVGPLEIVVALVLLYVTMGPAVFAGFATIILLVPVNIFVMTKISGYQTQQMTEKDNRVKLMSEILSGVKVLKLYAWEASFESKIKEIRRREISVLKKIYYLNAIGIMMWTMTPYLISLATFATYVYISPDHYLSPEKAFVAIALFNILRFSINLFPMIITEMARVKVSLDRISRYLCQKDLDPNNVTHDASEASSILIENGNFQWTSDLGVCLKKINIKVSEGQLMAVVGQVGSGKSSLISAILGDMDKLSGRVNVKGNVAYVPQEAWIQNATLRDNILFGKPYDECRYRKVMEACALTSDLEVLPGGDMTEIGEKGINLSGGQKQRVSVARAVYSEADVYLLDDPLSAVDAHVGKHIFEKVFGKRGILADKTRFLVTHGIHWLPQVDEIIVMVNGEISEQGSYEELQENEGAFAQFLTLYQNVSVAEKEHVVTLEEVADELTHFTANELTDSSRSRTQVYDMDISTTDVDSMVESSSRVRRRLSRQNSAVSGKSCSYTTTVARTSPATLTEEESVQIGGVKWSVYSAYFKAMGFVAVAFYLIVYAGYQGLSAYGSIWLSGWTNDQFLQNKTLPAESSERMERNDYFLGIYGLLGVIEAVLVLIYAFGMANSYMFGSQRLHDGMLHTVMRCAMSFFDTTPAGRIINRFSKDMDSVDEDIPATFGMFVDSFLALLGIVVVITYSTPIFLTLVIPMFLIFYILQRMYLRSSRQLRRLESRSRSPIFNHFSETVNGASVIRAYKVEERFIAESERRTDYNQMLYYISAMANRWLSYFLDTLGNFALLAALLLAVSQWEMLTGSAVGLSISYAMEITSALTWMVRMSSEVETNIVAVERIKEYSDELTEAAWGSLTPPPQGWPHDGDVTFVNFTTRYRPGLDLVLKGINIHISPGEKVGIVGRTGAGKSSMTLSLFRIIEAASGSIYVDGWNIADMGLHDLRANFTVLPQDPVIFSGSLRMNLDPLDKYTDWEIWRALEQAHMKSFVTSLPDYLEHECGEGGSNLSVGQKQLICLARSLLRKTKLLILDEATAAVDMETDELIQDTIRVEFANCTILTIAHRLNTIMDYDKILVLDGGLVREFDEPGVLLEDKNGVFYSMAESAGLI